LKEAAEVHHYLGETNEAVKVPIGKWFTLDYYYKEGNNQNGRFYMSITPDGEAKKIIFDLPGLLTYPRS
jgi:hypothetical protein